MSYPIRTTYNGLTIIEHDPANPGNRFQIEYSPGSVGAFFKTLEEVKQSIDYQQAVARDEGGKFGY